MDTAYATRFSDDLLSLLEKRAIMKKRFHKLRRQRAGSVQIDIPTNKYVERLHAYFNPSEMQRKPGMSSREFSQALYASGIANDRIQRNFIFREIETKGQYSLFGDYANSLVFRSSNRGRRRYYTCSIEKGQKSSA